MAPPYPAGVLSLPRRALLPICLACCAVLARVDANAAATAGDRTAVIGESVRGRAILARVSGETDSPDRVLVFGCVHGDETAGARVAHRLLRGAGPRNAELWTVPSLNPDGVAAGTRGNAHGVDLNRNFPFRWRALGGLEYSGPRALSEPESRAASRLIRRIRPDLTIWFHQPFGLVARSGGDPAVERRFAKLIGLPYRRIYRPPGSASSWQNRAMPASSAFVVELPRRVPGRLVRHAATAVLALAGELARP